MTAIRPKRLGSPVPRRWRRRLGARRSLVVAAAELGTHRVEQELELALLDRERRRQPDRRRVRVLAEDPALHEPLAELARRRPAGDDVEPEPEPTPADALDEGEVRCAQLVEQPL